MNNNGLDDSNSSFNQQFQNILGQSIPLHFPSARDQQNHQYQGLQQPNIPISPFNNNSSSINQRINFSPSLNHASGPEIAGNSIAPMDRLPTFTPVASPQAHEPNPNSSSNHSMYSNQVFMLNSGLLNTSSYDTANFFHINSM